MSNDQKASPEIEDKIAAATGRALNYISSGRTDEYRKERETIRNLRSGKS